MEDIFHVLKFLREANQLSASRFGALLMEKTLRYIKSNNIKQTAHNECKPGPYSTIFYFQTFTADIHRFLLFL